MSLDGSLDDELAENLAEYVKLVFPIQLRIVKILFSLAAHLLIGNLRIEACAFIIRMYDKLLEKAYFRATGDTCNIVHK